MTLQKNISVAGGTLETTTETVGGQREWVVCLRRSDGHIYTLSRGSMSATWSAADIHDAQARILRLWQVTREVAR